LACNSTVEQICRCKPRLNSRWQMIPKGLPSILSIDNLALFACNFRDANAQRLGDAASVGGDATSTLDFHSGLAFREDVSHR